MILTIGMSLMIIGDLINPTYALDGVALFGQSDVTSIGFYVLLVGAFFVPFVLFGGKLNKSKKRRAFTPETKKLVLNRQNHRCKVCGTYPNHWDFDHIGSRTNNSASNCQALCLDCHREKTTRESRQSKRR
jgi:hypothetical protein